MSYDESRGEPDGDGYEECSCMYGGCHVDDPRQFHPDPECSTPEERENHRKACEAFAAAEVSNLPAPSIEGDKSRCMPLGGIGFACSFGSFGLGSNTCDDCWRGSSR